MVATPAAAQEVTVKFACETGNLTHSIGIDGTGNTYAGFTYDQVAGLYQIQVQVPNDLDNTINAGACPISIQVGTATAFTSSQPGVTLAIQASH
jgi:hypothetical protein